MGAAPLGTGSFSVVRRGYLRSRSRNQTVPPVALKFIAKKGLSDAQESFLRRSLEHHAKVPPHPRIVRQLDLFEDDDHLVVVQEAMLGGDLLDLIQQEAGDGAKLLSERRASHIVKQICQAVCHLHAHGIAHRALAPEAVMVVMGGTPGPGSGPSSGLTASSPCEVKISHFSLSSIQVIRCFH
jgi:serine/threonine protein kinase